MTVRTPAGVVFSVALWNGAGVLAARAIAYPIVCGNTVVFRGSEYSPRCHELISEIFHEAVNAAVFGSFLYQGQICMSTERFVVDESVANEFVAKFAARAGQLPAGDPSSEARPRARRCRPPSSTTSRPRWTSTTPRRSAPSPIEAGHVHVNGATVQNEAQAPYGGMRTAATAASTGAR